MREDSTTLLVAILGIIAPHFKSMGSPLCRHIEYFMALFPTYKRGKEMERRYTKTKGGEGEKRRGKSKERGGEGEEIGGEREAPCSNERAETSRGEREVRKSTYRP